MRIRNSGSGYKQYGSKDSRSDSFRQGRRKGQKVHGTLLKWVADDMAWVNIDGHKLLAQLQSSPQVGSQLTFLIQELSPNIVLKEIFDLSAEKQAPLSLINSFESARTLFESQWSLTSAKLLKTQPTMRQSAFLSALSEAPKALASYMDTQNCLQQLNDQIDTDTKGQLIYRPWLLPEGRRHISIDRSPSDSSQFTESIYECELPHLGLTRIEFLHKSQETGYRIKTQYPAHLPQLKKYLTTRSTRSNSIHLLKTAKLSGKEHGGLLAEILFA